jgi:hypothetical protein
MNMNESFVVEPLLLRYAKQVLKKLLSIQLDMPESLRFVKISCRDIQKLTAQHPTLEKYML